MVRVILNNSQTKIAVVSLYIRIYKVMMGVVRQFRDLPSEIRGSTSSYTRILIYGGS